MGDAKGIPAANGTADHILVSGNVYTADPAQPWAEAVAIRDGKIAAVGSEAQVRDLAGVGTEIIDADGRLVLPGFTDTHVHLKLEPARTYFFEFNASAISEVREAVYARAAVQPEGSLLVWGMLTDAAALIQKGELDAVLPDRPILIFDGHRGYANSKALELAGVTRDTPDPDGGRILRDPSSGEPTGVLEEAAGMSAFLFLLPEPTRQMSLEGYRRALGAANAVGIVRMHSAGADSDSLDIFGELHQQGELPVRLLVSTIVRPPGLRPEDIAAIEEFRTRYHDDWVDANAVKFFQDGMVEIHTAAMLEPYADDPTVTGHPHWDEEAFHHAVVEVNRRGFHILTHAIGDRSVRETLDAYEAARKANGRNGAVLRVEHAEHISDADLPRFGQLDVIAGMHPLFVQPEWQPQETCLGPARMRNAYRFRSVAAAGARVAFGSDLPAYPFDPWPAFQSLVDGHPMPEQRISVEAAIGGYTIEAAYAGGRHATEGSITTGKNADLIVVSQNLFEVPPSELAQTKVVLTMVGGKVVHRL